VTDNCLTTKFKTYENTNSILYRMGYGELLLNFYETISDPSYCLGVDTITYTLKT
jgi:hypothetical protein